MARNKDLQVINEIDKKYKKEEPEPEFWHRPGQCQELCGC